MQERRAEIMVRRASDRHGFALVAVIWSLGLIVLLGTAVIVGAKYRGKVASSGVSSAGAAAAAESSVNLAIAAILAREADVRFPLWCRLPGGELALITVEEEIGKVDLNTASPAVLERLFFGLTKDKVLGSRIAASVLAVREAKTTASPAGPTTPERTGGPPRATVGFSSVTELDSISGMSPDLFRAVFPFVTVRSGRKEPERGAASSPLVQLLALDAATTKRDHPVLPGYLTVRADVGTQDGSRFVREALISFGEEQGRPYLIREWRQGVVRSDDPAPAEIRRKDRHVDNCLSARQNP